MKLVKQKQHFRKSNYSQEIVPAPKKSSEKVAFWKKCLLRKSICSERCSEVAMLKKFLSSRVANQKKYLFSKSSD